LGIVLEDVARLLVVFQVCDKELLIVLADLRADSKDFISEFHLEHLGQVVCTRVLFQTSQIFKLLLDRPEALVFAIEFLAELLLEVSGTELFIVAEEVSIHGFQRVHLAQRKRIKDALAAAPEVFRRVLEFRFLCFFVAFFHKMVAVRDELLEK
jgi:hypothetical protein